MITEAIEHIPTGVKHPNDGSFGIRKGETVNWWKCREQFSSAFVADTPALFFFTDMGTVGSVPAFIRKCEQVLELDGESEFRRTNWTEAAVWMSPHPFWKQCFLRRSLLTVLLRAGRKYKIDKDNFEEALFSEQYLSTTRPAVLRFFFGFTVLDIEEATTALGYRPSFEHGWWQIFSKLYPSVIRKVLTAPKKQVLLVGKSALWN